MSQPPHNNQQPPYYPDGSLPPKPGQFYYPPVPPLHSSRRYTNKILYGLSTTYVLGWLFAFIGGAIGQGQSNFLSNFGVSLFFGILTVLLVIDMQGVVSLQGLIQWKKRKVGRRILIGSLCFMFFPFLLAVYFVRTFSLYRDIPYTTIQGNALSRSRPPTAGLVAGGIVTLVVLICASAGGTINTQQTFSTISTRISPSPTVTTFAQSTQATPTKAIVKLTPTALPTKAPTIIPTHVPTTAPTPIPQPTRVPTLLKPTPVPTQPKPTPVPALSLVFTEAYAADYSAGSVSVHTLSGATLTITVTYCSGYKAVSRSLKGTSYADGAGNHTWTWTPETKCRGTATADVTASENGQFVEQADSFNVQ